MVEQFYVGGELYSGCDLHNAAEYSTVGRASQGALIGYRNGAAILGDFLRTRAIGSRKNSYQVALIKGVVKNGTDILTAAYAGPGTNRDWCLETSFSSYDVTDSLETSSAEACTREFRHASRDVSLVFVEGIKHRNLRELGPGFVHTPAWVKQRVRIVADWPSQIRALRRRTRQEIARMLRKHDYRCGLSTNRADIDHFYNELYRPYIKQRFTRGAIIVEKEMFLRECGRGVLLQLIRDGKVIAASMLRRTGGTMAIVWSGIDTRSTREISSGLSDTLDYFSLLYANLKGCGWLDFGPSRADLNDGVLRYKRKWGTDINLGLIRQPPIHWTCNGLHDAELLFLQQHTFLGLVNDRLRAFVFLDSRDDIESQREIVRRVISRGVMDYRVVSFSPMNQKKRAILNDIHSGVRVIEATSSKSAIHAAIRRD